MKHGSKSIVNLVPWVLCIPVLAVELSKAKLPGRMGNAQVTVQRLTVAKVDVERNLILVKGSIHGAAGSLL